MEYKGTDVSKWQPHEKVDWNKLRAAGIEFMIARASLGQRTTDSCYQAHCAGARAAGIATHAYHYLTAINEPEARAEARWCAKRLACAPLDGSVFVDVEDKQLPKTRGALNAIVNAFLAELRACGIQDFGIYANNNFWRNRIDRSAFPDDALIWLAHYGVRTPSLPCDLWQYSNSGILPGYAGKLDCDIAYTDKMVRCTTPQSPTRPILRKGDRGNAVKELQTALCAAGEPSLVVDGVFGMLTEGAVLRFQRSHGLVADGIVGPKTWGALVGSSCKQ